MRKAVLSSLLASTLTLGAFVPFANASEISDVVDAADPIGDVVGNMEDKYIELVKEYGHEKYSDVPGVADAFDFDYVPQVQFISFSEKFKDANAKFEFKSVGSVKTAKFIASIGEEARTLAAENNLYASVMIAQAILESASGTSGLASAPNNNLFGIKGAWKDSAGRSHSKTFKTQEDDGTGNYYTIDAAFRTYPDTKESLKDYAKLIADEKEGMGSFYKSARKPIAKTYGMACEALQGTYATSTSYASSLMEMIREYDLTRYDTPVKIKTEVYDKKTKSYRKMTANEYSDLQALVTSQIGKPYVWGGEKPETGFDCSGLMQWAYRGIGIELPRVAEDQARKGKEVPFDELKFGDLLFFQNEAEGVHHVAMYLGEGYYIHAPQRNDVVKLTYMNDYKPDFAKRVIEFEE